MQETRERLFLWDNEAMKFRVSTKGHYDMIDITPEVAKLVDESGVKDGLVNVFIGSSTCTITTMEYEEGVIEDIKRVLEELAPESGDYEHHKRWGDGNGAAHIKSALMGPNVTVPVEHGEMMLGTWQQIVLIDFDEKPRDREVIVTILK